MTESARDSRPGSTGFSAEYDPGSGRLVLAGACPMASAPLLARELERLRTVAPGSLQIDLFAAGDLDIGPAWLLHGAVNDLRAAGSRVDLQGPAPRHFAYFTELEAQGGGTLPAAPAASQWDSTTVDLRLTNAR